MGNNIKNNKKSTKNDFTICYFSVYEPTMARDAVLLKGFREHGVRILECIDSSAGFSKFRKLRRKHREIRGEYDVLFVGYLSNIVVPLARVLSQKKVVYNALCSMYEGEILDRALHSKWSFHALRFWLVDFFAFHFAHTTLVESESQKEFISGFFFVPKKKLIASMTGADDSIFYPDPQVQKRDTFTVIFRGWFLPATGVRHVLDAAKILKEKNVDMVLIGRGMLTEEVREIIKKNDLSNVTLITDFISGDLLRKWMLSSHVVLGQFGDHPRMERTIQNKAFEALALRMPYVTMDSKSNRELLKDKETCLFTKPADGKDIADKVLLLQNDSELRERIAQNGYKLYKEKLTPKVLAQNVLEHIT